MKISVIIPTFNEARVIASCIESLSHQNYTDFEVIVVDDGSTDNTKVILSKIKSIATELTILSQKHKGAGMARNLGAKKAVGEILVFVDADMTFDKVFLRKLVSPINAKAAVGTFSKEEYVSNWKNIWARCWNWNQNLPDKKRLPLTYPDTQKVFRAILKNKFDSVGGFSLGGYTDDWSLAEKLHLQAQNAPGARFYHSNPDTLVEVFRQARWSAKRKYKLGAIGAFITIVRSSLPFSLLIGLFKSVIHRDLRFLLFKIVYDKGVVVGIISYMLFKKGSK